MSSLDLEERRAGSTNMIQYAANAFNGISGTNGEATIKAIRMARPLAEDIKKGKAAFDATKNEMQEDKRPMPYVPTGSEIAEAMQEGLYR